MLSVAQFPLCVTLLRAWGETDVGVLLEKNSFLWDVIYGVERKRPDLNYSMLNLCDQAASCVAAVRFFPLKHIDNKEFFTFFVDGDTECS